jgi:hypothetical protein
MAGRAGMAARAGVAARAGMAEMAGVAARAATSRRQSHKTFFPSSLTLRKNKLECSSLASLSMLVCYVHVVPRVYTRVSHLERALLRQASALLANIRLGCK